MAAILQEIAAVVQANAFTRVMMARAEQARFRMVLAVIIGGVFHIFTGWLFAALWVAAYGVMQLIEVGIFPPARLAERMRSPICRRVALALTALNGLVFGAFAMAETLRGGDWGAAAAALLFGGAIINAVLTSAGSRVLFAALMAPLVFYALVWPLALAPETGWAIAAALMFAYGLLLFGAVKAWRLYESMLVAELAAREAAEAATEAKSAFIAVVSHELRTPISAILAGAANIGTTTKSEAVHGDAALITGSARMMRTLLNDLLDFSKIEAGKLNVESIPFDLEALLNETASFWRAQAEQKGLTLDLQMAPAVRRWAAGDPTRLRQVLNNLLSNALKFTTAGGVSIKVSQSGADKVSLAVADTGQGMNEAQLLRLFTPFDQLSDSRARTHGGTGLGLSISRQLAQLMGGDLTCQSREGEGTAFTLELGLPAAEPPESGRAAEMAADGLKVLIADDHAVNRKAFSLILSPVCAQIATVENGQAAVAALEQDAFDLVLMDLNMPVMDGPSAAAAIREKGFTVPIIALTGSAAEADREACLAAGMNGYVAKPVEAAELFAAIDAVFEAEQAQSAAA